jgi:nicotinate-nucleotide--dimethylbenzimidazole phosphoribosyltransferase
MVLNMLSGCAGINALADATGCEVVFVECGIDSDFPPDCELNAKNRLIRAKISRVSRNFYKESAMTEAETEAALNKSREIAEDAVKHGYDMAAVGDLGIGNTSTDAALLVASGMDADAVIDRGTGISDAQLARKKRVITESVARRNQSALPRSILKELGAPDIAMMTGFMLGLDGKKTACVIDGLPVTAASYMAYLMNPKITGYLFAGHLSKVSGHKIALAKIGLEPIVSLDLHLGDGTGAVIGGFVVQIGVLCALNMAAFDSANVSGKDLE